MPAQTRSLTNFVSRYPYVLIAYLYNFKITIDDKRTQYICYSYHHHHDNRVYFFHSRSNADIKYVHISSILFSPDQLITFFENENNPYHRILFN